MGFQVKKPKNPQKLEAQALQHSAKNLKKA